MRIPKHLGCIALLASIGLCCACGTDGKNYQDAANSADNTATSTSLYGYDNQGNISLTATVMPKKTGFSIIIAPIGSSFICAYSNYIVQDENQYNIGPIADFKEDFIKNNSYNGYISSGVFDTCTNYHVTTTWEIDSSRIGFDPIRPYQISMDSIVDADNNPQLFYITP